MRKHQHILNVASAIQMQSSLTLTLIKRLPSKVSDQKSPLYEILFNKIPKYNNLKTFWCLAYVTILVRDNKFSSRAKRCMYIGNSSNKKGYILYDLKTHNIFVSRDVVFHENIFPLENTQTIPETNIPILHLRTWKVTKTFQFRKISIIKYNIRGRSESIWSHLRNSQLYLKSTVNHPIRKVI